AGPGGGTGRGGPGDGPGAGGDGGGLKTVHWSEVEVKVRPSVRPSDYPEAAAALNIKDARCVVRIHIDERGVPYEVVPKTCPTVFRDAAQDVAMRYRFYPLLNQGRPVRAAFDLTINFR
ncbi:MAG: energy transducer TonB, partial [Pseudomonadota bacterium]|nr:energy transducer TonB [Pseudomonadota bacterium]